MIISEVNKLLWPLDQKKYYLNGGKAKNKMFCVRILFVFSLKMGLHSYQTTKTQDNQGNLCRPILVLAKQSSIADFTAGRSKNLGIITNTLLVIE